MIDVVAKIGLFPLAAIFGVNVRDSFAYVIRVFSSVEISEDGIFDVIGQFVSSGGTTEKAAGFVPKRVPFHLTSAENA
jgi:hypothetical protein